MTKTEIIAELRRSAAEDADPWQGIDLDVFLKAADWLFDDEILRTKSDVYVGTFYLLIAHALEDECAAI